MAKRTLSRKDGTAWPEAGMRSRESSERLRLRLQEIIPALVLAPAPSLTSRRFRLQLRFRENGPAPVAPAPYAWILGIFFYGSGADPDLTTIKYLGGSGQNVSARAVPTRAARIFRAAGGMLSGQEGVEWLKGR